jgi:hypothetical protein
MAIPNNKSILEFLDFIKDFIFFINEARVLKTSEAKYYAIIIYFEKCNILISQCMLFIRYILKNIATATTIIILFIFNAIYLFIFYIKK